MRGKQKLAELFRKSERVQESRDRESAQSGEAAYSDTLKLEWDRLTCPPPRAAQCCMGTSDLL